MRSTRGAAGRTRYNPRSGDIQNDRDCPRPPSAWVLGMHSWLLVTGARIAKQAFLCMGVKAAPPVSKLPAKLPRRNRIGWWEWAPRIFGGPPLRFALHAPPSAPQGFAPGGPTKYQLRRNKQQQGPIHPKRANLPRSDYNLDRQIPHNIQVHKKSSVFCSRFSRGTQKSERVLSPKAAFAEGPKESGQRLKRSFGRWIVLEGPQPVGVA